MVMFNAAVKGKSSGLVECLVCFLLVNYIKASSCPLVWLFKIADVQNERTGTFYCLSLLLTLWAKLCDCLEQSDDYWLLKTNCLMCKLGGFHTEHICCCPNLFAIFSGALCSFGSGFKLTRLSNCSLSVHCLHLWWTGLWFDTMVHFLVCMAAFMQLLSC